MQINVNAIFGATGEDGNKFRYFQIKRWEIHKYQNTTFPPGEEACKILQIKKKGREYCEDDICIAWSRLCAFLRPLLLLLLHHFCSHAFHCAH